MFFCIRGYEIAKVKELVKTDKLKNKFDEWDTRFKKIKLKVKEKRKKQGIRKKKKSGGELHITAKAQCRGRSLKQE